MGDGKRVYLLALNLPETGGLKGRMKGRYNEDLLLQTVRGWNGKIAALTPSLRPPSDGAVEFANVSGVRVQGDDDGVHLGLGGNRAIADVLAKRIRSHIGEEGVR